MSFYRSCTTLAERMIQGLAALVLQSSTGTLQLAVEPCEHFLLAMHRRNTEMILAIPVCLDLRRLGRNCWASTLAPPLHAHRAGVLTGQGLSMR